MAAAGWAIFHKEPNTAYAMGGCVEYGFIRLAWDAADLLRQAKACWCIKGWWNGVCSYRPVCRGWGPLPEGAPTLRHLGYHRCGADRLVSPGNATNRRRSTASAAKALALSASVGPGFACEPRMDYRAACIRQAGACPLKGVHTLANCRAKCDEHRGQCFTLLHNRHGECYLRPKTKGEGFKDKGNHGTVSCRRVLPPSVGSKQGEGSKAGGGEGGDGEEAAARAAPERAAVIA